MKIEYRDIREIRPYPHNPRRNDQTIESVKTSLEKFGFQQPIVVDSKGVIIVGHSRWRAAKELNYESVPVLVADNLSEDQCRAYRIMDNKTHDMTRWDIEELRIELDDLDDLDLTGFNLRELDSILFPELGQIGKTSTHNIRHRVIIECENSEDQDLIAEILESKGWSNWKKNSY
jgi:ParB-like chromosome segregation protein Spo0J